MSRSSLLAIVLSGLTALGACGQVVVTVGPQSAPLGCSIPITISNDTTSTFSFGSVGPIVVKDTFNNQVFFEQQFLFAPVNVQPGAINQYFVWHQQDGNGAQVPAGSYTIEVGLNAGTTIHPITIGGIDAAVTSIGVHRPGTNRSLYLCSPQDPNATYIMAASFTSNLGIFTCAGIVPLDFDFLFDFSTTPGNGVFLNTTGSLNSAAAPFPAATTAPSIAVPSAPISGLTFQVAFVVFDATATCPVVRISIPETITIL